MSPRFIGFAVVALIMAQVLLGLHLFRNNQVVPHQQVTAIDGRTIDLFNPNKGNLTLVSFWASTCKTCIKEMPDFVVLHKEYARQPLDIVGITMPYDQTDFTIAVLKFFKIPWPTVLDIQGKYASAFGDIKAVPTTLLVDHTGKVMWKHEGPMDFRQLRQQINQHLTHTS